MEVSAAESSARFTAKPNWFPTHGTDRVPIRHPPQQGTAVAASRFTFPHAGEHALSTLVAAVDEVLTVFRIASWAQSLPSALSSFAEQIDFATRDLA